MLERILGPEERDSEVLLPLGTGGGCPVSRRSGSGRRRQRPVGRCFCGRNGVCAGGAAQRGRTERAG